MKSHYTISEFYLFLKLGLWKAGRVANWGQIDSLSIYQKNNDGELTLLRSRQTIFQENDFFVRKPLAYYQQQLFAKKQLGLGIYLLDLYLLNKSSHSGQKEYGMVISVCRSTLENKKYLYCLKVISSLDVINIKTAIKESTVARRKRSLFRQKSSPRSFDSSPLNSILRKH